MPGPLTPDRLDEALTRLGQELRTRETLVEIAVYGGSAIMMQFDWRRSTTDVDAVVREGFREAELVPAILNVAEAMDLPPDWLNNAVGMFTPDVEDDALFLPATAYPDDARPPGLRVVLASPRYLLVLKLHALASSDRGIRDLDDARRLASDLRIASTGDLLDLYRTIYGEEPAAGALARFPAVLER